MSRLTDRWAHWTSQHTAWVLLGLAILTVLAGLTIPRIQLDNTVDVFFDPNTENNVLLREWKEYFARSSRDILVVFSDEDIFTEDNLTLAVRLTEQLEQVPHVRKVTSLATVNDVTGQDMDIVIEPLIDDIPSDAATLKALRTRTLGNPLFTKNIISKDGKTAGFLIELDHIPGSDGSKEKGSVEAIHAILEDMVPLRNQPHVAGGPVDEYYYSQYMQQDLKRLMPITLSLIVLILFATFRNYKLVLIPIAAILLSLLFTMTLLHLLGYKINNTTTIIPPIILAIAVANAVHFVSYAVRGGTAANRTEALRDTLAHVMPPCLLTSATTFVGFMSLASSESPSIRQTGIVAAGGVLIAFAVTFLLLPALWKHAGVNPQRRVKEKGPLKTERLLASIGRINEKYAVPIMGTALVIAGLSVWGLTRIVVETSLLEQIGEDSPVYKATHYIENNLSGTSFFHVSLKGDRDGLFSDPTLLAKIEVLQLFLEEIPEIDKTTSIADYIKDMNHSFKGEQEGTYALPDNQPLIAQYGLMLNPEDIEDFIDPAWRWATVTARMKEHRAEKMSRVFSKTRLFLAKTFPAATGVEARVLGDAVRNAEGADTVTRSQARSLALAMLLIFGMMFLVFRSFQVGLVSMGPNVLPLLINFGMMGLAGIWLDTATSIISAIGIGIIVDDTIHFLYGFGEALKKTGDYTQAMNDTLQARGRPIAYTTIILVCGFGALMGSRFVPTFYFGLLSALIMVNALLADLFLLPSLLIVFKPKFAHNRKTA